MLDSPTDSRQLKEIWDGGYSIAELWGFTRPVTRATSAVSEPHGLLWGILAIVDYQVDTGAGHTYLRERIARGDWIGIGFVASEAASPQLAILPQIENAKFGRKQSAVGDGTTTFTDVRFVHHKFCFEPIANHQSARYLLLEVFRDVPAWNILHSFAAPVPRALCVMSARDNIVW